MAADTIQFVDSIQASPTVRLDINDESTWRVRSFLAPPPRLRRSFVSNAMTDGGYVSSSKYDARSLFVEIDLVSSSQDGNAAQLQRLARELDRDGNLLRYQPEGASRPVFFRLFRSDLAALVDMKAVLAFRQLSLELLAEPFALGLRETISIGTVSNNPAAGSNGNYFDITAAQAFGDFPAPLVIRETSMTHSYLTLAARQHGTPSDLIFFKQAESLSLSGMSVPGGGPDAAMSGTGSSNYGRVTMAPGTGGASATWDLSADFNTAAKRVALLGDYRVLIALRRGSVSSTLTLRAVTAYATGATITAPSSATRTVLDLGIFTFGSAPTVGYAPTIGAYGNDYIEVQANWTGSLGGTETLDFDILYLFPADEMFHTHGQATVSSPTDGMMIDSVREQITPVVGDPFSGGYPSTWASIPVTGGWPYLVPNQTNRFYFILNPYPQPSSSVSLSVSLTAHYWPRYAYIRPVAS